MVVSTEYRYAQRDFQALAMAYERKGVPIGMSDQATMELLVRTEGLISTSTLSLVTTEQPEVQMLSLNGIEPSHSTMKDGSYPLVKQLFMVHDGELNRLERKFIGFVQSDEGSEILARTVHVQVTR
mgnify:CR=1 FL=1